MKTITEYLGKVSITCNGKWDINRQYDRLCLVHDGFFASYISKKEVPVGTPLTNEEYWQPVANLREDIALDIDKFKAEIIKLISNIQTKLKSARITVANEDERNALTYLEVAPGCEVYVLDTKQTWILDSIVVSDQIIVNTKQWHLEADGKIDSEEKYEIEGTFDELISDRAIADANGNIIHDTYISKFAVNNYVNTLINDWLKNFNFDVPEGSISDVTKILSLASSEGNRVPRAVIIQCEDTISNVSYNGEVNKHTFYFVFGVDKLRSNNTINVYSNGNKYSASYNSANKTFDLTNAGTYVSSMILASEA